MKKSLGILISFAVVLNSYSQSEFHDALSLKAATTAGGASFTFKVDPRSVSTVTSILRGYLPESAASIAALTEDQVLAQFITNPFIGDQVTVLRQGGASPSIAGFPTLPPSSFGNLNVTNIADGFAKFLVGRAKSELNVAFFSKLEELISKPEYKDAQLLFPQTYATLMAIGREVYNYEAYINALRESFEKDLASLLPNLKKVINDSRHKKLFEKHQDLKAICLGAIHIGQSLMDKVHPGQMLADLPTNEILSDGLLQKDPVYVDVRAAIETLQLFSESIRAKGGDKYWVGGDSVSSMLSNIIQRNLYLGLVYERAKVKQIRFRSGLLHEHLANAKGKEDSIGQILGYVKELKLQIALVEESIDNLKSKSQDKLTFSDYYSFYNSALDLIEYAAKVNTIPGVAIPMPSSSVMEKIQIARLGGHVALDISRRNYSSAIINLYSLYKSTLTEDSSKLASAFLLKYGSFIAAVAQAENSDDVSTAIEASALPAGSSRVKRETKFNVSLNGYVGLFAGYERISGVDETAELNSYGVSAPIGIAISRGHSFLFLGTGETGWKDKKRGWSTSLFFSVVDIGALAAFRFTNQDVETIPNVALKDIISPGVFLSLGVPKSPVSLNFGVQGGPLLRKVKADVNELSESYTRVSASICVDIPLLNFYNKPN